MLSGFTLQVGLRMLVSTDVDRRQYLLVRLYMQFRAWLMGVKISFAGSSASRSLPDIEMLSSSNGEEGCLNQQDGLYQGLIAAVISR